MINKESCINPDVAQKIAGSIDDITELNNVSYNQTIHGDLRCTSILTTLGREGIKAAQYYQDRDGRPIHTESQFQIDMGGIVYSGNVKGPEISFFLLPNGEDPAQAADKVANRLTEVVERYANND